MTPNPVCHVIDGGGTLGELAKLAMYDRSFCVLLAKPQQRWDQSEDLCCVFLEPAAIFDPISAIP